MGQRRPRRQEHQAAAMHRRPIGVPAWPAAPVEPVEVVHAGASHAAVAEHEAARFDDVEPRAQARGERSEEHTSELQSLMRISYAVFCLKTKKSAKHTQT